MVSRGPGWKDQVGAEAAPGDLEVVFELFVCFGGESVIFGFRRQENVFLMLFFVLNGFQKCMISISFHKLPGSRFL